MLRMLVLIISFLLKFLLRGNDIRDEASVGSGNVFTAKRLKRSENCVSSSTRAMRFGDSRDQASVRSGCVFDAKRY